MASYQYVTLREIKEWKMKAAEWFHSKWHVPVEAYLECMDAYLNQETELGWYLCIDEESDRRHHPALYIRCGYDQELRF